jgi:hypothetical protein
MSDGDGYGSRREWMGSGGRLWERLDYSGVGSDQEEERVAVEIWQ